jgi:hypothetical protein
MEKDINDDEWAIFSSLWANEARFIAGLPQESNV